MTASQPMVLMEPVFNLCGFSRLNGVFNFGEKAKKFVLAVDIDVRPPLTVSFMPANTHNSRFVGASHRLISTIRYVRYFSQIFPSIIVAHVVDVIGLVGWKVAGHIQKCEAVSKVLSVINTDEDIPIKVQATSNITNLHTVGSSNQPSKHTRFRTIFKQFFQSFLGYNLCRHLATPSSQVIRGRAVEAARHPIIPEELFR